MGKVAGQEAAQTWILERHAAPGVDRKPGALVERQRTGMVEGAGVYPEPLDRARPRALDRGVEQKAAEAAADEVGDQPKIAQFGFAGGGRVEFEIARRHPGHVKHEYFG